MNKTQNELRLLPRYFSKISFGMILATICFVLLTVSETITFDKEIAKTISKSLFLISLLIIALTKNKIEDELTIVIRLKALAASFIWGVLVVIIDSLINLISDGSFLSNKGVTELLLSMFLFYFLMVFIYKRNR
jgi:hypothetical protein